MMNRPIITSMLDDDWYKYTMGSVVFHLFPRAKVTYRFICRSKVAFPPGFADALRQQINFLEYVGLTNDEADYLKTIPYVRPTYVEWLWGYKMDGKEVTITQDEKTGELEILISGYWYRTIYWEVKLMAIISELYFLMTGQQPDSDWAVRIENKALKLQTAGCHWIDFGTRRRFSYAVQDEVVRKMKYANGFLGTSNPHLAMRHGVTPHGTYAHECVMAMSALYGDFSIANKMWMKHWSDHFEGNVGVALTDTFTTDAFLQDFGTYEGRLFDGVRQDSGSPSEWAYKMLAHYRKLGIPTNNKRFVFSDNLNTDKFVALHKEFNSHAQVVGGIGTHFSNDVGVSPLNMVIKMTSANFGRGLVDVIKLSDDVSKSTGNPEMVSQYKKKLGIL